MTVILAHLVKIKDLNEFLEAPLGVSIVGGEDDDGNAGFMDSGHRLIYHLPSLLLFDIPIADVRLLQGMEEVGHKALSSVLFLKANKHVQPPIW